LGRHINTTEGAKAYLISLIDELVSTRYQLEPVDMVELGSHLVPKEPPSPTRTDSPSVNVFGVGPNKITECTFVRNFLCTSDNPDLIDRPNLRAQTAVNAENLSINDGG